MGLSLFKNCSVYPSCPAPERAFAPNPNPAKFQIFETKQVGANVVVKIRYPDCTNYEGVKICLFVNTTEADLKRRERLGPHFCEDSLSPFARFKPTVSGWEAALKMAETCHV